MSKILKLGNYLFFSILLYVFYGAMRSSLLNSDKISNALFLISVLLFLAIVFFLFSKKQKEKVESLLLNYFCYINSHIKIVVTAIVVLIFVSQLLILSQVTVPIGWDVLDNFNEVTLGEPGHFSFALSVNPNNQFFFFMMYYINKLLMVIDFTGKLAGTWFGWQVVNCLFIDFSLIFLYIATRKLFNKSIAFITFCLFAFSIALSPWILTPYTDTMVLPFLCLILYFYSILKSDKHLDNWKLIVLTGVIGCLISISFLMKPSSIVFLIAFSLIQFIRFIFEKQHIKKLKLAFFLGVVLCGTIVSTHQIFKTYVKHQTIISIDSQLSKPWTLFVMMGLTGTGGYNEADTKAIYDLPTPEAKKEYTIEMIKNRLSEKGFVGYLKFLANKNLYNTANGDFGWGVDGTDLVPLTESNGKLQSFLRDLYYPQTIRVANIRFIMQIVYIITLLGMLFSLKCSDEDYLLVILKLTYIGAILYLLLFEGGRSRYLIQFLPFMYILAANGIYLKCSQFLKDVEKKL